MRPDLSIFVSPSELDRIRDALTRRYELRFKGVVVVNGHTICASEYHRVKTGVLHPVVIKVERGDTWKYDDWEWCQTSKGRRIKLVYSHFSFDAIYESEDLDRMEVMA